MRSMRWAPMSRASLPGSESGHAKGTPAYRRLTLAMLFAGFSTFSLLYSVQPLLPEFARDFDLSAEAASLAVSLGTGPLAVGDPVRRAGVGSDRAAADHGMGDVRRGRADARHGDRAGLGRRSSRSGC